MPRHARLGVPGTLHQVIVRGIEKSKRSQDEKDRQALVGRIMKFLHTADTHLGFEITRIGQSDPQGRRKRADRIFKNFLAVLDHARDVEADLLIHSGDLLNKYYLPREIVDALVQPILELAKSGTRILIIPGNHERSEFPFDLFQGSPGVYVFDRPKSFSFVLNNRIETRFVPLPVYDLEMVEIQTGGLSSEECLEAIRRQFWRFDEDRVIRFNLTGGDKLRDYPEVDFQKLRAEMPPILECQFAIKAGQKWVMR